MLLEKTLSPPVRRPCQGNWSLAKGEYSVAIGNGTEASGAYDIALGGGENMLKVGFFLKVGHISEYAGYSKAAFTSAFADQKTAGCAERKDC